MKKHLLSLLTISALMIPIQAYAGREDEDSNKSSIKKSPKQGISCYYSTKSEKTYTRKGALTKETTETVYTKNVSIPGLFSIIVDAFK